MVISPDGMGIIIVGGYNHFSGGIDDPENIEYVREKRILQSRFDGFNFLPWQVMDQELENVRAGHVVIPIPKIITNCN